MRAPVIVVLSLAVGCSGDISKFLDRKRRGKEYSLQKNYWLALDEFRDAIRPNPEDADAYALVATLGKTGRAFSPALQ